MNILITGGTSGLGKAIINACAEGNNILFTFCTHAEDAQILCEEYKSIQAVKVDFKSPVSVDAFLDVVGQFNPDVLINNTWVGSPNGTYFHKTSIDDFQDSFNYNIVPLIKITQACISCFRKKKSGKIITVLTSYLLNLPPMGFSVYTATKSYIEQLSKCWSKENARFGITSNCVSPEFMMTSFAQVDERIIEQMQQAHPLKRLIDPKEVADVIRFFVNASSQVNGVNIPITAGQNVLK